MDKLKKSTVQEEANAVIIIQKVEKNVTIGSRG
jgi:hypothetical protein